MKDEKKNRINPSSFILHPSNEAYGSFAYAYDQALGQRFFRASRRLLRRVIEQYPPRLKTHLDVGCGTAMTVEYFQQLGYRSAGVDLSIPMLQLGRHRSARLVAGDMRALPLRGSFARITSLYDSLNHMKSAADLTAAFRSIARVLDEDGLLLFDVNHPDVYPRIWGTDEPFVAEGRGFHLEMATKFRPRDRIAQALVTGWAEVGGKRVTIRELRQQRAYNEREVVECLAGAGLVPIEVTEFDPYTESRKVKLFFVCRHIT